MVFDIVFLLWQGLRSFLFEIPMYMCATCKVLAHQSYSKCLDGIFYVYCSFLMLYNITILINCRILKMNFPVMRRKRVRGENIGRL